MYGLIQNRFKCCKIFNNYPQQTTDTLNNDY